MMGFMTSTERAIGMAMRVYRRSPLYPRAGRTLAKALAKMPGRPSTAVRTIRGVTYELDLSDTIGASLYYSGTFEAQTERLIESRLEPGMVAVDVGANFGYHTFRLAQGVGPTGRVLAIEPMTEAWNRLRASAALNNFRQVTYIQAGLSDADEGVATVAFKSHYDVDGSEHIEPGRVRVTTLDVLVAEQGFQRVDFIKIDVDGYEAKVFRGARGTLERWRPDVLFEISPGMMAELGDRAGDVFALLDELGYRLLDEDRRPVVDRADLMDLTGDYSLNLFATYVK
jgi:FkbM family methyltransferase